MTAKTPRKAQTPRAVVLIDEIDKADVDVPNTLLGVLGDRSFKPPFHDEVRCDSHWPLVIITSNNERDLPLAFLRRCLVLTLQPESGSEDAFVTWMEDRARAHPGLAALFKRAPTVARSAAQRVWEDRQQLQRRGSVGLAEYLDLLHAVVEVAGSDWTLAAQWVDQLRPYVLQKYETMRE